MNIFGFFSRSKEEVGQGIGDIFPISLIKKDFVYSDLRATYTKILTDVLERTHGIDEKYIPLLWDNCVQGEAPEGLITLLVSAMIHKSELFLVYKSSVNVLRKADTTETQTIRKDYKSQGKSATGVYLNFKNYDRTDMLRVFSEMEYCTLASLHKTMNVSRAIQIKMSKLRGSVSLSDSSVAIDQAKGLALALREGQDIFLDGDDNIVTATTDISPTVTSIGFINSKRAYYLDLPMSYISGIQTPGIGSTGEADARAVDRGLKQYYFSIIQPALKALFDIDPKFTENDFREMGSAIEMLKTFDLVSGEYISEQSKREIVAKLFDLDPKEEKRRIDKEQSELEDDIAPAVDANANAAPNVDDIDPNDPANRQPAQPPRIPRGGNVPPRIVGGTRN
jgi:hypothetical protein